MRIDEELQNFQQSWEQRRAAMLERHQRERAKDLTSLPVVADE